MVGLLNLPDELLVQVFSAFMDDKAVLCKLALQCSRLSCVIRILLLQRVVLDSSGFSYNIKRRLFMGSLEEAPFLAPMVRELALECTTGDTKFHQETESMLETLVELRTLNLVKDSFGDLTPVPHPLFANPPMNPARQLSKVLSEDPRPHLFHLAKYMFQSNLKTISVGIMNTATMDSSPRSFLPAGRDPGTSPVSTLELDPSFHLPFPALEEILRWPKALNKFRGALPGDEISKEVRGPLSTTYCTMDNTLAPSAVSECFASTKHSLQELELIDRDVHWSGHDGSQMNLQGFRCLRKVNVPAICFFTTNTLGSDKNGFYKLLPSSLVELQILYDFDDSINPPHTRRSKIKSRLENFIDDFHWIKELADNKSTHFLNLEKVSLLERCGTLRSGYHPVPLNLPPCVAEALEEAQITFRGVVRARLRTEPV